MLCFHYYLTIFSKISIFNIYEYIGITLLSLLVKFSCRITRILTEKKPKIIFKNIPILFYVILLFAIIILYTTILYIYIYYFTLSSTRLACFL